MGPLVGSNDAAPGEVMPVSASVSAMSGNARTFRRGSVAPVSCRTVAGRGGKREQRAPSRGRAPKRPPPARKPRARRPSPRTAPARAGRPGTGAEALVAQLEAAGVEAVFGIPGVHNLAIFDALRRSGIRTVLVRHEQTAGYAADGYARATGRVGVAVTTTGPGAANVAAAMGEARASRSPVLHVSTQIESRLGEGRGGRFSLHESPQQRELMAAVSVWSATVARAEAIPSMTARAIHEAFGGRRGPVFLEIPHDFLAAPVEPSAIPAATRRLEPDERSLARASDALGKAKRPVVWAGGGVISAGASDAQAKVAETLDAPVVTTFAAKGVLSPAHPLLVGFPPHQPEVTALIERADAVLIAGSDLDGMNTQGWRIAFPRPRVSINTVPDDLRRNYAADVAVEADVRVTLEALLGRLEPRRRGTAARRVEEARAKAAASLRASKEFAAPYRFTERLSAAAGDAIVVADMAVAGYWMAAYHRAPRPRLFQYPLGWGTLGYALPAAVGAAVAGHRVLAVCGDAGFLYAAGELATIAQEGLPVVVLVVDDGGYGMLRFDERERYGDVFADRLETPDLVALARAFGIEAGPTTAARAGTDVKRALATGEPALLAMKAAFAPPLTTSPRWPRKGRPEARP